MKMKLAIGTLISLVLGLVALNASGVETYGLGFIVPQISGKANVANPAIGELIYDQDDATFYGRDDNNTWVTLGGGASADTPTGSIIAFGGTSAPSGFLLCDGSAVSRTTYADLFAVIGTNFGSGNGSTTFNLPDLRGRFLRGVDGAAARDPDSASRTAMSAGGNAGNNVGSVQADAFKSHTHPANVYNDNASLGAFIRGTNGGGGLNGTQATNATGGNETRPINAYVNYLIKY